MAGVFVSYRRDDSQGFAGRLADDLTEILGPELVFRDVEIPVGHDFREVLNRAVAASDMLLVVIGRSWLTPSATTGKSRLFDPVDWVRAEIESAFDQGKQVIPVLVAGAKMMTAEELPDSIRLLASIQAFTMADRRWDEDIEALVQLLCKEAPELASYSKHDYEPDTVTPAQVLLELGNRIFDEVNGQRNRYTVQKAKKKIWFERQLVAVGRFFKKTVVLVLVIAVIYIGLRLFGDDEMLQGLDNVEARLQIGWDRLLGYFESLDGSGQ